MWRMLEEHRGGALYFAVFCMLSYQGRFMSLFYEEHGLDDQQIGIILSVNSLIGMFASPMWTGCADASARADSKERYIIGTAVVNEVFFLAQYLVDLGWVSGEGAFWWLLVCRVCCSVFFSAVFPLINAVCVEDLMETHGPEGSKLFGVRRLWGAVSWLINNFLLGLLIDTYGTRVMYIGHITFTVAFVVLMRCWIVVRYSGTVLRSEWVVRLAERGKEDEKEAKDDETLAGDGPSQPSPPPPTPKPKRKIFDRRVAAQLCSSYPNFAFFVLSFAMSAGMSIVENLVFLYFTQELGASSFLCGVSVGVTVAFEIPLFFVSHKLLTRFSILQLIVMGTMAYVLRVLIYTLVPNGWWVLVVEPLHGVTIALMSVAGTEFIVRHAPKDRIASAQGLTSSLRSAGSTLGVFCGGQIITYFGQKALYRAYGAMVFAALVLYIHAEVMAPTATAPDATAPDAGDEEELRSPLTDRSPSDEESDAGEPDEFETVSLIQTTSLARTRTL